MYLIEKMISLFGDPPDPNWLCTFVHAHGQFGPEGNGTYYSYLTPMYNMHFPSAIKFGDEDSARRVAEILGEKDYEIVEYSAEGERVEPR